MPSALRNGHFRILKEEPNVKKRILSLLLLVTLLFSACGDTGDSQNANAIQKTVADHRELLLACVKEMEAFREERIYVAIEKVEVEVPQNGKSPVETQEEPKKEWRLVSFGKETDDRTIIESPVLQEALEVLDLELIFYQTAADSRRCVIFSFCRESYDGTAYGFYYSFDNEPCGWWGRVAKLTRKDNRYLQLNEKEDAWYYTLKLAENFYYFEKEGSLLA